MLFQLIFTEMCQAVRLKPLKLDNEDKTITEFTILPDSLSLKEFASQSPNLGDNAPQPPSIGEYRELRGLKEVHEENIKPFISSLDYKEQPLVVTTMDN